MKKILFILLLLPCVSKAQLEQNHPEPGGHLFVGVRSTSWLRPPSDTTTNKTGIARIGTALYIGNGTYWSASGLIYTGTTPISVSGTVISMAQASAIASGYLSSTDWSLFNAKQDALVSGTNIKTVNSSSILGSGNLSVGTVTGTGTANNMTKFTGTSAIGNALMTDDGSVVTLASGVTTGNGFSETSSTLTTGNLMKLTSTSTVVNNGSLLSIASSGANSTASKTVNGAVISVTNTGTTNTNVGLSVTASGATNNNNIAIQANGIVAITAPVINGTGSSSGLSVLANSLTTGTGVDVSTTSLRTGTLMKLTSSGTALQSTASNVLSIISSGTNVNSSVTATGQTISVTNTGTTSTNNGLVVTASGATNSTAITATSTISGSANGNLFTTNMTPSSSVHAIGTNFTTTITPAAGASGTGIGQQVTLNQGTTANLLSLLGYQITANITGASGTTPALKGININGSIAGTSAVSTVYGSSFDGLFPLATGTVSTQYGYYYDQLYLTPTTGYAFYSKINPSGGTLASATDVSIMPATAKGVGIGIITPSAKLHTISTTEQLRLGYDASNYYSTTVGSTGIATFNAVGAGSSFEFSDRVAVPKLKGNSSTPSITGELGAGTSPTVSITGTDLAGEITVTTDVDPITSAVFCTITFATAFSSAPYVVFSPSNDNAAIMYGVGKNRSLYVTSNTTVFELNTNSVDVPMPSTEYKFMYHVIQ